MSNDRILAIETSTRRGSVALGRGRDVLGWRALSVEQTHTTELLPTIRDLLAEAGVAPADVGVVVFSQGPGSFTGLRVAATLARTWQSATGGRVVAVPTLAVVARNALSHADRPRRLAVIQDVKRGQLLAGLFERDAEGEFQAVGEARRVEAAAWLADLPSELRMAGAVRQALAEAQESLATVATPTEMRDFIEQYVGPMVLRPDGDIARKHTAPAEAEAVKWSIAGAGLEPATSGL